MMRIVLFFLLLGVLPAHAQQKTILEFTPDDSLDALRAKIEHNGYSFSVGHTWVYDLPGEVREGIRGRSPGGLPLMESEEMGPLENRIGMALPSSFDWRSYNGHAYIGSIRDQGFCGSCYAFAACAAAECTYNFAQSLYDAACANFSESFIIWCLGKYGPYGPNPTSGHFGGCDGADYDYAELLALTVEGVCNETSFPYTVSDPGSCTHWSDPGTAFSSWHRISCGDIDAIKTAIMTYGAVDAAILTTSAFDAYTSGVYEDANTSCDATPCYYETSDHAISLIGWNDNPPEGGGGCWILRNSWGTGWGESGYMRIRYTSAGVACAAAYLVAYAPPAPYGRIAVSSTPSAGADIFLDYFYTGSKTSATLDCVSAGTHQVYIVPPAGIPAPPPQDVGVTADAAASASFNLNLGIGSIDVVSAPETGGAIYLDYQDTGLLSPATLTGVTEGLHYVLLRKDTDEADDCVKPGFYTAAVTAGGTTPVVSDLELATATASATIQVSSEPDGAEIYLDYIDLIGKTNAAVSTDIGCGVHTVSVRKSGYISPPPQVVDLTESACATSLAFTLLVQPTPTPVPPPPGPTATPFPSGLRLTLNQGSYRPGDTLAVQASLDDSVDFYFYLLAIPSNGRTYSLMSGNRVKKGVYPYVSCALMEVHGGVTANVFSVRMPDIPGTLRLIGATVPAQLPRTAASAKGPYGHWTEVVTTVGRR